MWRIVQGVKWVNSRNSFRTAIWAAVSRVVVRDGRPRPISSSWTGSAAQIKRSLKECRAHDDPSARPLAPRRSTATIFNKASAGGPRLGLIRHGDCGYDLELSYFQIDGWSSDRSVGPDDPTDWLVMRAPGGFLQTNQQPYLQPKQWTGTMPRNFIMQSLTCDGILLAE